MGQTTDLYGPTGKSEEEWMRRGGRGLCVCDAGAMKKATRGVRIRIGRKEETKVDK
jgi:hypothetical protein